MANRNYKPGAQALEKGLICLYGQITTSTDGAIASQSSVGFSAALTASEAGRYTITLDDKYPSLYMVNTVIISSADTAYVTGKGLASILRNVAMATKTFDVQFVNAAAPQADADVEDGAVIHLEIVLKNSNVPV